MDGIKEAAANFVTKLWEGDQAIIADFNERIRFSSHFSDDIDRLVATIQSLYPCGLDGALRFGLCTRSTKFRRPRAARRSCCSPTVTTHAPIGQGSEATAKDAIEGAKFSEVTIYAVGFQGRRAAGSRGVNKGFLRDLAEETGGSAFFPKGIGDLNRDFEQIQDELHSQYRLAYIPTNKEQNGEWRKISVPDQEP